MDDRDLFQRYAISRSKEAFRLLIERNVAMVYSVALRKTGNPSLAEEIAKVVFIILAKTRGVSKRAMLSGWLHRMAHQWSIKALREKNGPSQRRPQAHAQSGGSES